MRVIGLFLSPIRESNGVKWIQFVIKVNLQNRANNHFTTTASVNDSFSSLVLGNFHLACRRGCFFGWRCDGHVRESIVNGIQLGTCVTHRRLRRSKPRLWSWGLENTERRSWMLFRFLRRHKSWLLGRHLWRHGWWLHLSHFNC